MEIFSFFFFVLVSLHVVISSLLNNKEEFVLVFRFSIERLEIAL